MEAETNPANQRAPAQVPAWAPMALVVIGWVLLFWQIRNGRTLLLSSLMWSTWAIALLGAIAVARTRLARRDVTANLAVMIAVVIGLLAFAVAFWVYFSRQPPH